MGNAFFPSMLSTISILSEIFPSLPLPPGNVWNDLCPGLAILLLLQFRSYWMHLQLTPGRVSLHEDISAWRTGGIVSYILGPLPGPNTVNSINNEE